MGEINPLPWTVVQKLEEAEITHDSFIFYQNGCWVYKIRQRVSNNNQLHCEPIDSLGPFDIHPVDVSFILFPSTSKYTIIKIGNQELSDAKQVTGVFAPIAPITLDGSARSAANIPDDATHFCWLYPPNTTLIDDDIHTHTSYEASLLKIGGFAYVKVDHNNDDSLQLLRVNSLSLSAINGLTFEGPDPWRKEFTNTLWSQNRFQPVTLPYLIGKGAQYFAFINPYESLSNENGQLSWMPSRHGAFVYLFNEDHSPHSLDCYFSVADNCLGVAPSDEGQ